MLKCKNKFFIKKQIAFSLIELLIVITIVAILASVGIPSYSKYLLRAKIAELFIIVDSYKLQLIEKIINNEFDSLKENPIINHPNNLIEQIEYLNIDNKKYVLKIIINYKNIGIKLINNIPLTVNFIAQEDHNNELITWSCEPQIEYQDFFPKNCLKKT